MLFETKNGWITENNQSYIQTNDLKINIDNGPLVVNNSVGYMYLDIKETSLSLYGFKSLHQRSLFLSLIKLNGIGCKLAANLCDTFNYDELVNIIVNQNIEQLTSVKGISQKIAFTIVNGLSTKLVKQQDIIENNSASMIVAILVSLGLSNLKANQLVLSYPNIHNDSMNQYLAYLLSKVEL